MKQKDNSNLFFEESKSYLKNTGSKTGDFAKSVP